MINGDILSTVFPWIVCQVIGSIFPFNDSIIAASKIGITHAVQPGGSICDDTVINECDKRLQQIDDKGIFEYGTRYPFSFEVIHNPHKDEAKTFFNFDYTVDVWHENTNVLAGTTDINKVKIHNQGFTSFYVYTSLQNSGEIEINDFGANNVNTRKVGNSWKINLFKLGYQELRCAESCKMSS